MCQPQPRARHHLADHRLKAAVPGVDNRLRRLRRMEIDRQLQRLRARQDRPEEPVVEIAPAMVAVDDDALEAVLGDHALEFRDRGRRIGDRQRGQPEKPGRMTPDGFGERSVGVSREGLRFLDVELLDAGRRQRQRLHVDAGGVHRRDAAVANVDKLGDKRREPPAKLLRPLLQPAVGAVEKSGRGEMFLKGDRAHSRNSFKDGEKSSAPPSASPQSSPEYDALRGSPTSSAPSHKRCSPRRPSPARRRRRPAPWRLRPCRSSPSRDNGSR